MTLSKSHVRRVRLKAKRKLEAFRRVIGRTTRNNRLSFEALAKRGDKDDRRQAERVKDKQDATWRLWDSKRQPHKRWKEEAESCNH